MASSGTLFSDFSRSLTKCEQDNPNNPNILDVGIGSNSVARWLFRTVTGRAALAPHQPDSIIRFFAEVGKTNPLEASN